MNLYTCGKRAPGANSRPLSSSVILAERRIEVREGSFPGGPGVKNLPCNARDTKVNPWSWRSPHALEQLSPCAATAEATPRAHVPQEQPPLGEACAPQLESGPCSWHLEKACAAPGEGLRTAAKTHHGQNKSLSENCKEELREGGGG